MTETPGTASAALPAHPPTKALPARRRHAGASETWRVVGIAAGSILFGVAAVLGLGAWLLESMGPVEGVSSVSCAKALSFAGGELPERATDEDCEKKDTLMGPDMRGTFRMPRADVHAWLAAYPGDRSRSIDKETPDGIRTTLDGVVLDVDEPPDAHPNADVVQLTVVYESERTARVRFETFNY
ncbi:hypothetical protein M1P56_23135 [Streptomyces sp. HU2014]|uniref:hypothetical protein n=1 Tax=Streptomyces sp. HU2014 TaxID=2939414 RepID=UPI00200F1C8C|nr:hypothetical protein [Streptomyces sp. HU2014]UQI47033.1 hypothetical protein M1P56_23135 [Streptomyces sp. HU2014]